MTTQDCQKIKRQTSHTFQKWEDTWTYDASAAVELGKAQESSDSVVVDMQESCRPTGGHA